MRLVAHGPMIDTRGLTREEVQAVMRWQAAKLRAARLNVMFGEHMREMMAIVALLREAEAELKETEPAIRAAEARGLKVFVDGEEARLEARRW